MSEGIHPEKRPRALSGNTVKIKVFCGDLYVTLNWYENKPFEVFFQLGKSGGCPRTQTEALARQISISLRAGVDINEIIEQLLGIRCPTPFLSQGVEVLSCPDGIGKALKMLMEVHEGEKSEKEKN